jgi:PAS domain S-box-containing protein
MAAAIRVLYVDDESALLELSKVYLERLGEYIVTTVQNAPEAIRLLELARFDAIVSDYQMPEMDGIEFLKIVRGRGDKTPFIIFTGKGREEVVIEALNSGADFYLQKGGEPKSQFAELSNKIQHAVSHRQADRALIDTEKRYRTVFENTGSATVIVEENTIISLANAGFEHLSGFSKEEIEGKKSWTEFVVKEDLARMQHQHKLRRTEKEKALKHYEFRFITRSGDIRDIFLNIDVIPGTKKSVASLIDITDRKRTEQALQESERQFRALSENNQDYIMRYDREHRHTYANPACLRVSGMTAEQFIGKTHRELGFPPDLCALWESAIDRVFATGQPYGEIFSWTSVEGNVVLDWRLFPEKDGAGSVVSVLGVSRDITDRKKAEETLRKSEERFKHISDLIPDFAYSCRKAPEGEFAIDWITGSPEHITGYTAEEIKTMTCWKFLVVDEDVPVFEKNVTGLLPGESVRCELRIHRKDGGTTWLSSYAQCVPDQKEPGYLCLYGACQDITERKRAEEALRQSEEMHRLVLEFAGISSTLWTTDGRLLMINRYGAANLGGAPKDFLGKTMAELFGPEAGAVYLERIQQVAATGTRMEFEDRVPLPEGDRWFLSAHTCLKDAAGQAKRVMIFSHDITRRKIAELAHRDSTDRLAFAIDGAHLGLWDVNYTNHTISHNRYWNEILGYGPEDSARSIDWWRQSLHPDDLPVIDAASLDHQNGKTPVLDIVYRIRHRDGRWLWIHTIGRVISRSAEGKPLRMSGINQDITELKQAEKAILDREEKFREIFNNVNDAIHLHEVDEDGRPGKFIDVNDVACQMVQYSRDEMLQHNPLDFATQYHSRPVDTIFEELRTVGHATFETGHTRKDGTIVPVEINAHKIILQGRPVVLSVVRDITERKQWEATLRTDEERLNLAIESACIGLWDLNYVTNDVVHNRQWTEMLGYSSEEMTKPSIWWQERVHPDDLSLVIKSSEDHSAGRKPFFDVVYRMKHKDGSWRWVHSQGKVVSRDSDGRPLRMIGINQDVTDRKQIEEALREREASYRQFFSTSRDSVFITTPEGKFVDFNDVIVDLLGYRTREELADVPIPILYEDANDRKKFTALIIQNGYVEDYPVRLRKKDGTIIDTLITTVSIKGDNGSVTAFFGTIRDVTRQKRAEEEIRTLQQFQQSIIDNANDWISVLDPKGTILVWNTTAEQISGYPSRDVIGKNTVWKQLYPDPVYRKQVVENILDIIKKNTYVENFVTRIRTKNGDEKIIWWNTQPLRDASGNASRFIAIGRDNTERSKVEEALKQKEAELHDILEGSPIPNFVIDRDHRIISWNKALEEATGFASADMLGTTRHWQAFYDRERPCLADLLVDGKTETVREWYAGKIDAVRLSGGVYDGTDFFPHLGYDGKWLHFSASAIRDARGNVIGAVETLQDITRQKHAEDEIRTLQQFQQSIIDNANVWISVLDPKGTILVWNTTAEQISGYPSRDVIGKNTIWKQLYPDPVYRKQVAENILDIIKKNTYVENFETRIRTRSGDEKIIWWNTQPLRDASGNAIRFIAIGRDNTERKRVEEELRESEERYSSLFDNSNSVFLLIDPDTGRIMDANAAASRYYQYTRDELVLMGIYDLNRLPKENVIRNLQKAKGEKAKHFFSTHYLAHGERRNVEIYSGPITLHGKPLFYSIIHDITDRRQAEEKINALRQFEESVIKNANIWISVLDGKGNVSVWNRAAEEISGYRADEVIGKNIIWSQIYPDKEYRRSVTAKIKEVIGTRKYLENFETRIRTKDGQERIIWWNTRALQDIPGIDETFIAIGKDVTEQKTLSDAVTLANKKLNLLSSITRHDILNQLMALKGYLELSRDLLGDPVKLEEYVTREQSIANTIESQIQFTKDYERMGIKAPEWQNVHESIEKAKPSLPLQGIAVETDSPTLEVYADPLLMRVFYNLIDNAIRYGGEQMTAIRFSSRESSRGLVIVCEDNGVGIPADKKEAIFKQGYFKHTGLGLFLSREILGITGITITENGVPGKGARFEITVPEGMWRWEGANE